jgi:hypothetical protein
MRGRWGCGLAGPDGLLGRAAVRVASRRSAEVVVSFGCRPLSVAGSARVNAEEVE